MKELVNLSDEINWFYNENESLLEIKIQCRKMNIIIEHEKLIDLDEYFYVAGIQISKKFSKRL